jgi:hypothetical protein
MSSAAFDTLRLKHPADRELITSLETAVLAISSNRGTVIDERSVAQMIGVARECVEPLLVELVREEALRTVFFWDCPDAGGTAWYGDDIRDAPSILDCPQCSKQHFFSEADVEVHFVSATAPV